MKGLVIGVVGSIVATTVGGVVAFTIGIAVGECSNGGTGGDSSSTTVVTPGGTPPPSKDIGGATSNPALWTATQTANKGDSRSTVSMLMGEDLEASFNDHAENGIAYGALQINRPKDFPGGNPVHPDITIAQAEDPVYVTNYMASRYRDAASSARVSSDALWQSNPELAAEQVVQKAEVPGPSYYVLEGAAKVRSAYNAAITIAKWLGVDVNKLGQSKTAPVATAVALADKTTSGVGGDCSGTGSGGGGGTVTDVPSVSDPDRAAALTAAFTMLGKPYSFAGGDANGLTFGVCTHDAGYNDCNIKGIDCSGLVLYAFHKIGIDFDHKAASQYQTTAAYTVVKAGGSLNNAKPGDLVFFEGAQSPGHVAIYIGDGKVIQAPQSGEVVKVTPLSQMSPFTAITDPFAWHKAELQAA